MIKKILAFSCVIYTCVSLSIPGVQSTALSVPSVGIAVSFAALFGVVLGFWITASIKK